LREIKYVPARIDPKDIDLDTEEAGYTLMTTKFEHCHYEEEYRAIMRLNTLQVKTGLDFKLFDQFLKFKN